MSECLSSDYPGSIRPQECRHGSKPRAIGNADRQPFDSIAFLTCERVPCELLTSNPPAPLRCGGSAAVIATARHCRTSPSRARRVASYRTADCAARRRIGFSCASAGRRGHWAMAAWRFSLLLALFLSGFAAFYGLLLSACSLRLPEPNTARCCSLDLDPWTVL